MRPVDSVNNAIDAAATYAELPSEFSLCRSARIQFADSINVVLGQLGTCIILALGCVRGLSTFRVHVPAVVGVCTQEQMVRVDAATVIAMVTYQLFVWNRAVVELKAIAMCRNISIIDVYRAVAAGSNRSCPFPAVGKWASIGVLPETFFGGLYNTTLIQVSVMAFKICSLQTRVLGYGKELPAATGAEFGLSRFWGMLSHVNSPFSTLTTPPDVCSVAVATLSGCYSFILAQVSEKYQWQLTA
jgi:hypothetical protein